VVPLVEVYNFGRYILKMQQTKQNNKTTTTKINNNNKKALWQVQSSVAILTCMEYSLIMSRNCKFSSQRSKKKLHISGTKKVVGCNYFHS